VKHLVLVSLLAALCCAACSERSSNGGGMCEEGQTRCVGFMVQKCNGVEWIDWSDCQSVGEDCEMVGGEAMCDGDDTDHSTECNPDTGLDTAAIPECEDPDCPPLDWFSFDAGTFEMGREEPLLYEWDPDEDEGPVHQVALSAFEILRTEVTVAQYRYCVEAEVCAEPEPQPDSYCLWYEGVEFENHPVDCVDWFQAGTFCVFAGGRLPSEAEWEYAARSAGQDIMFPWGDEEATCDLAVMSAEGGPECCGGENLCAPCSKPSGASDQGLCDLAGNVNEWVQDRYHDDYEGAPEDGSAWEEPDEDWPACIGRVLRGGDVDWDWFSVRATRRHWNDPAAAQFVYGFRCAR
jgi:formylglycine-generating enzyme required for sulfatase activity